MGTARRLIREEKTLPTLDADPINLMNENSRRKSRKNVSFSRIVIDRALALAHSRESREKQTAEKKLFARAIKSS